MAQKLFKFFRLKAVFGVFLMTYLLLLSEGCLVPDPIESQPQKPNMPPVIESYSPTQSYVILQPGEEKLFSINKVKDEDPENLSYIWYLDDKAISNGTFLRFVAPPLPSQQTEYLTLKVVVSDGEYETQWWWTIIITSP